MRDLLGRIARAEGALGAACLAGLLACGLILIAALTLEDSQSDRRTEAGEIRALVASGRELGRVIAATGEHDQPPASQAWNRRIIEEMGGSISAANRAEGGACFEILLPAARQAAEPQAVAA